MRLINRESVSQRMARRRFRAVETFSASLTSVRFCSSRCKRCCILLNASRCVDAPADRCLYTDAGCCRIQHATHVSASLSCRLHLATSSSFGTFSACVEDGLQSLHPVGMCTACTLYTRVQIEIQLTVFHITISLKMLFNLKRLICNERVVQSRMSIQFNMMSYRLWKAHQHQS